MIASCMPYEMVRFLASPPCLDIHDTSFMHPT